MDMLSRRTSPRAPGSSTDKAEPPAAALDVLVVAEAKGSKSPSTLPLEGVVALMMAAPNDRREEEGDVAAPADTAVGNRAAYASSSVGQGIDESRV